MITVLAHLTGPESMTVVTAFVLGVVLGAALVLSRRPTPQK